MQRSKQEVTTGIARKRSTGPVSAVHAWRQPDHQHTGTFCDPQADTGAA